MCLGCGAAGYGLWLGPGGSGAPPVVYGATICAGVNFNPRPQVGVAWTMPHISAVVSPVFFWPRTSTLCGTVPWLSVLPPTGGLMFPP